MLMLVELTLGEGKRSVALAFVDLLAALHLEQRFIHVHLFAESVLSPRAVG